jgi:gliding motility-associated-like protein
MNRILLLFYFFAPIISYSQSQEYYFNNNLQGTNGGGDLTSVLSCSATTGGFSSNVITTTAGLCGTFDTYCFTEGEGFSYPNTGITGAYTINMFFKFNTLGGYSRLIDFSNGASDTGFYIYNDCLNLYPNGNIGTCPFFLPNVYYLLTFVRNASTNFISVYVNGTLFGSYSDAAGTYKLATNTTPIIFFRDDMTVPCEDKPGCVKYISITPTVQTASQVNATWLNVCNIVSPCPTLPTATIVPSSPPQNICLGSGTNIQFSGTPNATVSYTVNNGANQTIVLDATGNATLATGNLAVNSTYAIVSASLGTCFQIQSASETVSINTLPTASIAGTAAICSGSGSIISFSGTPNATVTYQINAGPNQTLVLNAAGNANVPTGALTATASYDLVSVAIGTCSQTQTGNATVSINALPTVLIAGTAAICSGSGSTISFSGTPNATVTYQINAGPNQTLVLNAAGNANVPTGALTATASYDLVSVAIGTCSQAQTGNATVSVNALPTVLIAGTAAICSGSGSTISFSGTPNATVTYKINAGPNQTLVLDAAGNANVTTGALTATASYDLVSVAIGTCSQTQTGNATVSINPKPLISSSTGSQFICVEWKTNVLLNGLTLQCNSNSANFTFQWQLNNIDIPGATSQNYTINSAAPGTYKVFTKSISTLGCANESNAFVVVQSGPASFLNPKYTVSNFFSENQHVTVHIEGYGNYEYSMDGNAFQGSNIFNNVSTGTHYITIKDINSDCAEVVIENIQTIDYPKFFTPNNDGINDIWTIKDLSRTLKGQITIYDRLGKLVKVIQPSDIGWDGTLNGSNLPATDYWFSIDYTEDSLPKIFKSHFSLIR